MPPEEREPTVLEADQRIEAVRSLFDSYATASIATSEAGDPWVAKVFFVDDSPEPGSLDLCAAMIITSRKLAILRTNPRVAFVVAGDTPDRWVQGTGTADVLDDEAEAEAIRKALEAKSTAAGPFLRLVRWKPVRIHVRRLKYTDVSMRPPVAEFTFS